MITHTQRTPEQVAAFRGNQRPGAVCMLNMIRFHETAVYGALHGEAAASGQTAYRRYKQGVSPLLLQAGAQPLYMGEFEGLLVGPTDERWDTIFVMHYPSLEAILAMTGGPAYAAIAHHRTAAVADYRLVRMHTLLPAALPQTDREAALKRWADY